MLQLQAQNALSSKMQGLNMSQFPRVCVHPTSEVQNGQMIRGRQILVQTWATRLCLEIRTSRRATTTTQTGIQHLYCVCVVALLSATVEKAL